MSRRPVRDGRETTDRESFLGRWSRRKREVARGVDPDEAPGPRDDGEKPVDTSVERTGDEPVLTDADMPDIDSIGETSSVAEFFSPGVSEALRRKALRKLFHSPKFNVRDGLDDFDEDYTYFEKLGDTVTSDMRHRMELEAEKLRERQLAEIEAAADASPDEAAVAHGDEPQADSSGDDAEAGEADAPNGDEPDRVT